MGLKTGVAAPPSKRVTNHRQSKDYPGRAWRVHEQGRMSALEMVDITQFRV